MAQDDSAALQSRMITHDRQFFYKYVTARAAKAILRSGKVRWSSPILFNDPFDINFDLRFPFSKDELQDAMTGRVVELLTVGRSAPINSDSSIIVALAKMMEALRKKRPGMSAAQILNGLAEPIKEGVEQLTSAFPELRKQFRQVVANASVFCVSEVPDSLLMWAHYGDSHRGAVLKFECLPEMDTALCAAFPVTYQREIPLLCTPKEFLDNSFAVAPLDTDKILRTLIGTKSVEWDYEREWRVVAPHEAPMDGPFEEIQLLPAEIVEITFGCRSDETDQEEIRKIALEGFPRVSFSRAQSSNGLFALEFEPSVSSGATALK